MNSECTQSACPGESFSSFVDICGFKIGSHIHDVGGMGFFEWQVKGKDGDLGYADSLNQMDSSSQFYNTQERPSRAKRLDYRVDIVDENSGRLHNLLDAYFHSLTTSRSVGQTPLFMSDRLQQEHATVRKWQQRKNKGKGTKKRKKRRHPRGSRENDIGEETERKPRGRHPRGNREDDIREETERTTSERKPRGRHPRGNREEKRRRQLRRNREEKKKPKITRMTGFGCANPDMAYSQG
ncbi:hypothetical protein LIPSTDRAFT_7035 [Lipomyces starkeyi NRRL Y-11557]|uniref:Uncharacterized protein n=1 Tax=Lipomyces starkeyi NRRL Y-11557 TaxID=675824 RepID=A0A1E3PVD7_LIPST|nr:hypothetical protein LIPSTDRAFT_7035 [Lipomyces starkeyi NRRL Y-11557]